MRPVVIMIRSIVMEVEILVNMLPSFPFIAAIIILVKRKNIMHNF